MRDLPTRELLGSTDDLAGVVHNLLAEIGVLAERVAALESTLDSVAGRSPDGGAQQARIDGLVGRTLTPYLH